MYVKWTFQDMDSRLKVGGSPGLVMERLRQRTSDADLPGHCFGAFQPAIFFSDGGPMCDAVLPNKGVGVLLEQKC